MKHKLLTLIAALLGSVLTAGAQEAKVYTVFNQSTQTLIYRYDNNYDLSHPYQEEYTPDALRFALYYNLVKRVTIEASMAEAPLTSMRNLFYGGYNSETGDSYSLYNMKAIEGLENLNTANVTDMHAMFCGCQALEFISLSKFNTANVTDMGSMFRDCWELTSPYLGSFNTEKVTDMSNMFYQTSLTTLDLTSFDTDKVTDMSGMFYRCGSLTTIYCSDNWSTSTALAKSDNMFFYCVALVGGEGTVYNSSVVDATYARPDGGTSQPGYFTKVKIYTEFVEETGTLTYRYDNRMASRPGITELYDPVADPDAVRFTGYNDKVVKVVIDPSMKNARLTSMNSMFYGGFTILPYKEYGLTKMTVIEGLENLNTAKVTNMTSMFAECRSLKSLDLTTFNTARVTDMSYMFSNCSALTTIYCYDDWSASAVLTSSDNMFFNCNALVGGKGTAWNSSYKDKTYARPDGGTSLPGYFTKERVYTEFVEATGTLTYYYDDQMASRTGVTVVYDPVGNPDVLRFKGYYDKVTKAVIDPSMKKAPLTSMLKMFYGLMTMTTIEGMENLNTSNVTDMSGMFSFCGALTSLDLTSFNTANVTDMSGMFAYCFALTSLDLSAFNTANVTDMSGMFRECYSLASLDLTSFNTANVEDMNNMFYYCFALASLDLTSFNTANVTDMSGMFRECYSLASLDLRSFNIAKVTTMLNMFFGSERLKTIWCDDDWSTSTVLIDSNSMFGQCTSLVGGKGTSYDEAMVQDVSYARPDGGTESPGYFTKYEKKVYTEYDEDTQTLTYYYDALISLRTGVTEVYDPVKDPDAVRFTDYYSKVTKAVIDPSMQDARLTSMNSMFYGGFNIGTFNVQGLFNMTTIEGLENLYTTQVTTMMSMFAECEKLTTLDLHSFNTAKVTDMGYMFSNCKALTTIYCNDDLSASDVLTSSEGMFSKCNALVGGMGTAYDDAVRDKTYARPDGGTEAPGYFTAYVKGDANGDGNVTITDAVAIVNKILGNASGSFNEAAADVNGDGDITITDAVGVVNLILQKN